MSQPLDYSLKHWSALTQFVDDGQLPIDNNRIENQIRPIVWGEFHLVEALDFLNYRIYNVDSIYKDS